MALPHSEEKPGDHADNEKKKAILKLLITILVLDAIAVAGFFALTLVLGWNETLSLVFVVLVAGITGFYYQWKLKQING